MRRKLILSGAALLLPLAMPGCTLSPEGIRIFNANIGSKLGLKLELATQPAPANTPRATTGPSVDPTTPDNRDINAQFIREMYQVVLNRAVQREEFDKLMNAIDQGGHYEAFYNGIVYGTEYHDKEKGVAPVPALKAYSEIIAQLRLDQAFDPLKIAKPSNAGDDTPAADASGEIAPPQPTDAERQARIADAEREAVMKSTFTLKRKLGEEVLKTIDLKKEYREKLATWYGRFTVSLIKRGVDFGAPLRSKADEYYHYKWALSADEDRLKWECLNRLHRIINQGAGLREVLPPATSATPTPASAPAATN